MHHVALVMFAALGINQKRLSPTAFWIVVLILATWSVVFAAASWDYNGYLGYFQCATTARCGAPSFKTIETSLIWLSQTAALLFGNEAGAALVALYSVPAVAIKLTVLRRESCAFGVALFAYLCFGFFVHEMTQVRVGLAIAFLWLAMAEWAQPQRKAAAAGWLVLAVIIHNSAIIALGVPLLARIRLTTARVIIAIIVAAITGYFVEQQLNSVLTSLDFAIVGRFGAYLADAESEISRVPQFSIYIIGLIVILFCALIETRIETWTKTERLALSSVVGGVILFLSMYWFAVIGQRVMELLTSPFPLVAAAAWQRTRYLAVKAIIIFALILIFYNLVIRNGVMKDFVLDETAQHTRIMQGATN